MAIYNGNDWLIAWDTTFGGKEPKLEVGPFPDHTGWSDKYEATSGCCFPDVHGMDATEQARCLLNEAASLMFQGIPSQMVLQEFAKIGVWCEMRVNLLSGNFLAFHPRQGFEKWAPFNVWLT